MTDHAQSAREELSGIGRLLRAGQPLAKIFYNLELRRDGQNYGIEGDLSVSQDTAMRSQVLAVLDSDEVLTVELADGRKLEVHTTLGDKFSGRYHIVAHNPPGFMPA